MTGPDHVKDGHPGVYECQVGKGYPTPSIQWRVVTTSGNTLAFETGNNRNKIDENDDIDKSEEEDDDEKGSMSWLTVTGNKSLGDLTVERVATNIAGYTQSSITTIVTCIV